MWLGTIKYFDKRSANLTKEESDEVLTRKMESFFTVAKNARISLVCHFICNAKIGTQGSITRITTSSVSSQSNKGPCHQMFMANTFNKLNLIGYLQLINRSNYNIELQMVLNQHLPIASQAALSGINVIIMYRSVQMFLSPFDSSVLKPNFHLSF